MPVMLKVLATGTVRHRSVRGTVLRATMSAAGMTAEMAPAAGLDTRPVAADFPDWAADFFFFLFSIFSFLKTPLIEQLIFVFVPFFFFKDSLDLTADKIECVQTLSKQKLFNVRKVFIGNYHKDANFVKVKILNS